MSADPDTSHTSKPPSSVAVALKTAGTLSALIFLISSIDEVLRINNLYESQRFLIGLLLLCLAVWAWMEVRLIGRFLDARTRRMLTSTVAVQLGVISARQWMGVHLGRGPATQLTAAQGAPLFREAILFLAIDFLLFLAIAQSLIHAFSHAEFQRAMELEQQMRILNRTQEELAAAREREKDAAAQQRTMLEQKLKTSLTAAAVVHEIQQPLASILLHCRLASEALASHPAGSLPEWQHRMLGALTTHGDQVVTTMERMRMLLRNVETEQNEMDLASSLHSSLLFLHNQLQQHHVQVSREGLDSPILIQGDSAQLQIAVVNLVRNAIQAMEQQPNAGRRLHLQLRRLPGRLEMLVSDSGPGFPEGYHNDTSWELLKSTKVSGMGLGLFLASTAASNHRGRLRIGRSAELGGAEVILELPLDAS